jgi:hypothetical protein
MAEFGRIDVLVWEGLLGVVDEAAVDPDRWAWR